MSIFSKIFATDKAVDNIVDKDNGLLVKAGKWVDHFNYTPEERALANKDVREWGIRQLDALAPFKVVQRILAFAIMGQMLIVSINVMLAIWWDSANQCRKEDAECVASNVATPMLNFAFSDFVFWPTVSVLALYFSGGVLPGVFNSGKKGGGA